MTVQGVRRCYPNAAANKALQSDAFKARIAQIGDEVAGGSPHEFSTLINMESRKWGEVIERAGIRIE